MIRRPPSSTLFPTTTLFRPRGAGRVRRHDRSRAGARLLRRHPRTGARRGRAVRAGVRPRRHDPPGREGRPPRDRKSTRLNSSHLVISYAVFCLKKKEEAHTLRCFATVHSRTIINTGIDADTRHSAAVSTADRAPSLSSSSPRAHLATRKAFLFG